MASESAFTVEKLVAARVGETVAVGPWRMTLNGVEPVAGPNWTALQGDLAARYEGGTRARSRARRRAASGYPPQTTSETALHTRWNGQLYTVLGEDNRATGAGSCACGGSRSCR